MPADSLTTDDSLFPIVVHTTVGVPSEAQVAQLLRRSDELLARRTQYVVIFDNTAAGSVPGYMRRASIGWVSDNKAELERWCVGMALVVRSPALRFIMSTVMLLTSHTVPSEVFSSREDAVRWGRERLGQAERLS